MTTYTLPQNLGDILGAHHDGNFQTQSSKKSKPASASSTRGTILATGTAGDIGKLVLARPQGRRLRRMACCSIPRLTLPLRSVAAPSPAAIAKKGSFRGPRIDCSRRRRRWLDLRSLFVDVASSWKVRSPFLPLLPLLNRSEALGQSGLGQSLLPGRRGDPRWRGPCPCGQVGSRSRSPTDRSPTCTTLAPTARKQGQEAFQRVGALSSWWVWASIELPKVKEGRLLSSTIHCGNLHFGFCRPANEKYACSDRDMLEKSGQRIGLLISEKRRRPCVSSMHRRHEHRSPLPEPSLLRLASPRLSIWHYRSHIAEQVC